MKGKKILIIGAGQHCRVVLYNLLEQGLHTAVAIGDINPALWDTKIDGCPVVAGYKDFDADVLKNIAKQTGAEAFFIGTGNMKIRKKLFDFFIDSGWESVNIVHPDAVVSKTARLGTGILIEAGCLITPAPVIGDNVVINTGSQVNHDNVVGAHAYIASGVVLSGGVSIGENTLIDDSVTVCLGKKVGSNCLVGAGSVVTKDVPDQVIAYGNPCKVIRQNERF